MASPIRFGTDGWRGVIAEDFTFDNVRICAQAVARYLLDSAGMEPRLVVGYDTRFGSARFAAAVAEVAAANGVKTYLCQKTAPTPVTSFSILDRHASGAVIVTASHNPGMWNGLKYKPEYAGSASPEVVTQLEARINRVNTGQDRVRRQPLREALDQALVEYLDPDPPYFAQIAKLVNMDAIRRAGLTVAVDSMYGAGGGYFRQLLAGGATTVVEIHGEPNPAFPRLDPEPIARNLRELSRTVRESGAAVGLATDGDSDRIGVVDEQGKYISQLQMFGLLTLYLLEVRGERGPLVKTLNSTMMAHRLGELYRIPVVETPIGFKYASPAMIAHNALIAGEESGGFGFRHHIPERDALLAGLYLLDMMIQLNRTPSQLLEYLYDRVGPHHYDRWDFDFPPAERDTIAARLASARPSALLGEPVRSIDDVDGHRLIMQDRSWLLIRFSGTEPILRVYAEAGSPDRVQALLVEGRTIAGASEPRDGAMSAPDPGP